VDGQVYNVCAENGLTVLEITDRILRALGKPSSLVRHVTDRLGHDRRYWLTSKKLREHLDWAPSVSFEEGIQETVLWYVEHPTWWRPIKSGEFREYYRKQYAEIAGS
jgi:dTDP-glucose 4,6-dehydratase